jgi:hypothetical protein
MINPWTFVIILISHWVGDYLLQFNAIANHKSHSIRWLTLHVLIYTSVLFAGALFIFSWEEGLRYCAVNAILHFVTDLVTGKFSSKYKSNPRIFYPIIGFDQLIHTVTLLLTLSQSMPHP